MFIRLPLSAALVGCLAASFATAALAKPVTTTAETNLRKAPGTKSEVVSTIPKGTEVDAGDCDAGWCKVIWGGQEGYVIARNIGMIVPGAPREAAASPVPRQPRQSADLNKLRQGYEEYFDDQAADQSTQPRTKRYAARPAPRDDDDDEVVYGAGDGYVPMGPRTYVAPGYYAPPGYYYAGPRYYYGGWGWGPRYGYGYRW